MIKKWVFEKADEQVVNHLQQALKIDRIFCELLAQRGITDYSTAKQFFRPTLSDLHDPFLMKDMDKAVNRLVQAMDKQELIMLYGDYDVDGTTSVALMYDFLSSFHSQLIYYIPDRYKEGYGISTQGVEFAKAQGVNLIIAMDCGIKAVDKVDLAKTFGMDMIICDHHLPDKEIPKAAAVLDPKRSDCPYPYKELSGCGIAFKLAQAYIQEKKINFDILEELLDLVVVSIACDIVPITGENRVLAYYGLEQLNKLERLGLKALVNIGKRNYPLSISDVVFGIGPLINAAGRLDDAKLAVRLLLAENRQVARENAEMLKYRNSQRKEFEQQVTQEATEQFKSFSNWQERKAIVLFKKDWHKGVIGIVASRMIEAFHRPTIILTLSEGKVVGSARSVKGFDIHEAIHQCEDLLVNFGGHQYAAGLTLLPENMENFRQTFEKIVADTIPEKCLFPEVKISAAIDFSTLDRKFWRILKQFAPFGPQNMRPIFCTKNVKDDGSKVVKDKHLKLAVQQNGVFKKGGIAFGMGHFYEKIKTQPPFDICYTIEENNWQGRRSLQLNIKDIQWGSG